MKLTDNKFITSSNNSSNEYSADDIRTAVRSDADVLFDKLASELFSPELGKTSADAPALEPKVKSKYPGMWAKGKISRFFRKLRSGGMTSKEKAVASAIRDGAAGKGGEDDPRVHAFLEAMWDRSVSVTAYADLYPNPKQAGLSADSLSSEEHGGTTVEAQMGPPGGPPMPPMPGGPGGAPMGMPPMGMPGAPPPKEEKAEGNEDKDEDEEVEDVDTLTGKLNKIKDLVEDAKDQIDSSAPPPSGTGSTPSPAPRVVGASIYRKIAGPGDKDEEGPADLNLDSPDDEGLLDVSVGSGWEGPHDKFGPKRVPVVQPEPTDKNIESKSPAYEPDLSGERDEDLGVVHMPSSGGTVSDPSSLISDKYDINNRDPEKAKSEYERLLKDPVIVSIDKEIEEAKQAKNDDRVELLEKKRRVVVKNKTKPTSHEEGIKINTDSSTGDKHPNLRTRYVSDPKELPAPKVDQSQGVQHKVYPTGKEPLRNKTNADIRSEFDKLFPGYAEEKIKQGLDPIPRLAPHGPAWMRGNKEEQAPGWKPPTPEVEAKTRALLEKEIARLGDIPENDDSPQARAARSEISSNLKSLKYVLNGNIQQSIVETDAQIQSRSIAYELMALNDELKSGKKRTKVDGGDGTPSRFEYVDLLPEDKKELQDKIKDLESKKNDYDAIGGKDNSFRREVMLNAKAEMHKFQSRYNEVVKEIGRLSKSTLPSDKQKLESFENERQYLDQSISLRKDIATPVIEEEKRKETLEVIEAKLKDSRRYMREHVGLIDSLERERDGILNAIDDVKMKESLVNERQRTVEDLNNARASGDTKLIKELELKLTRYNVDPEQVDEETKRLYKDLELVNSKISAEQKKSSMFEEQVAAAELERKTLVGDVTSSLADPRLLVKTYDEPHYAVLAAGVGSEVKNLLYSGPLTDSSLKQNIKSGDEEKLPGGRLHGALEQAHIFAYNHIQAPLDAERAKHAVAMDHTARLIHNVSEKIKLALEKNNVTEDKLTKELLALPVSEGDQQLTLKDLIKTRGDLLRKYKEQKKTKREQDKSGLVDALAKHMTTGSGMRVPFKIPGTNEFITADDIANGVAKHALTSWLDLALFSRLINTDYNSASTGDVKYRQKRPPGQDWNIDGGPDSEYEGDPKAKEHQQIEEEYNRLMRKQPALKLAPTVYENTVNELKGMGTTIEARIADFKSKLMAVEKKLQLVKTDVDKKKLSSIADKLSSEISGLENIVKNNDEFRASSERLKEIGKLIDDPESSYYKYLQERRSDPEQQSGMNADVANPSKLPQQNNRSDGGATWTPQKDMRGRNLGQQYIEASTPTTPQQWDNGVRRNIEIGFGLNGGPPKLTEVLLADAVDPGFKPRKILVDGEEVDVPSLRSLGQLLNKIQSRTVAFNKYTNGVMEMRPRRKVELQPIVDPISGNPVLGPDGKPKMEHVTLKEYMTDENGNVIFSPVQQTMQIMDEGTVGPKELGMIKAFNEILWHAWSQNRNMVLKGARNNKGSADKTTSPPGKPVKKKKLGPGLKVKPEPEVQGTPGKKPAKPVVTAPTVSSPTTGPKVRPLMKKSESDKVAVDDEAKSYYKKMFPGEYGKQMGSDVKTKKKIKKKSDRLADVVDSVESVFSEYGISDNARIAAVSEFVADGILPSKYSMLDSAVSEDPKLGKVLYKLIANHVIKHNMDVPFGGRIPSSVKNAVVLAAFAESGLEDKIMRYVAQKMKVPKVKTKSSDSVDVDHAKDEAKKSKPVNRSYGIEFNVDDMYKKGYYVHMVISWDPDEQDAKKSIDGLKQAVRSYVKGLESAKEFHNIGFLGQIEFKELDEDAGIAEVYFKTRIDGDAVPVYRDVPKSKNK